MLPYLQDSQEK